MPCNFRLNDDTENRIISDGEKFLSLPIPAWARSSVAYAKQAGIVQGKGNNPFVSQAHTTRAEAVTVLLNMLAQKSK
ncbi:S-layer homology domain-containing protein [Paenibacillus sp. A51L]